MPEISQKEYTAWITSAILIPVVLTASESAPIPTLISTVLCLLLAYLPQAESGGIVSLVRWVILPAVLAKLLSLTHSCWNGRGGEYAVPALLLLMGIFASWGGEVKAARASAVLRYGIIAVAGAVLLPGILSVDRNTEVFGYEKISFLFPVLALTILKTNPKYKPGKIPILAAGTAVLASFAAWGNLGPNGDFYTLSKSVSINGTIERYESLAAVAITLGLFASITVLLIQLGKNWKKAGMGRERTGRCIGALASACLYLLPWELRDEYLMLAVILFWAMIPAVEKFVKKGIDKSSKRW